MTAVLAPDCGPGVGLGHLDRALALAEQLQPDWPCVVSLPADATVRARVEARGFRTVASEGPPAERALRLAADGCSSLVIVDGYGTRVEDQMRLRQFAPLVVVNDLGEPSCCDLAVNPSPGGESLRPRGCDEFIGGASYHLLAQVYRTARVKNDVAHSRPQALVATGGNDMGGIGARIAAGLVALDHTIDVILVHTSEWTNRPLALETAFTVVRGPSDLAGLLRASTIYVGAAGTTALQAACLGVPAVITAAVPNQRGQAAALVAAGCAVADEFDALSVRAMELLEDSNRLTAMRTRGLALIDGCGAERVAHRIRQLCSQATQA